MSRSRRTRGGRGRKWDLLVLEPTSNTAARSPFNSQINSQARPVLSLCLDNGSSQLCNLWIFPRGTGGPKFSEKASISGLDVSNPRSSSNGQLLVWYQILQRKLPHRFNASVLLLPDWSFISLVLWIKPCVWNPLIFFPRERYSIFRAR